MADGSRRTRRILRFSIAFIVVAALSGLARADAQSDELVEAREEAQRITSELEVAEARVHEIEWEIVQTETILADDEAKLADIRRDVQQLAVDRYVGGGQGDADFLASEDINRAARSEALGRFAKVKGDEVLDDYQVLVENAEHRRVELAVAQDELAEATERLAGRVAELDQILVKLESEELVRLAEVERRRVEEERARLVESQRIRAENSSRASPGVLSTTGWTCVVDGPHTYVDSWGFARSGGRRHKGIDIMASEGTPVVAPVSGVVTTKSNSLGGKVFHLTGDDGNRYYGAHLVDWGESGRVSAGTVIGYVGRTGNARYTAPHLHFEIQPGGGPSVNPYQTVNAHC